MSAAAGPTLPHHPPGVPGRVSPAAAGSAEPLPRGGPGRRVTDLLLPAANRRRSRGRRDFIHSFIKKRRSAAGKRALPGSGRGGPPPPAPRPAVPGDGHSRQSASSLLSEQSSSSSHFQMAGMHRSFRHWNWSSSHSLTAPARHRAAPGSEGRAPPAGASRGRLPARRRPRTSRAGRREAPAEGGGWGWARQGRGARRGPGEMRLRERTAVIPELLCVGITRTIPGASRHCFNRQGEKSLGIEDG